MTMATLIIILQLIFPFELRINFETMDQCLMAMDNTYSSLPISINCEEI
jgi:hypothetical protein